MTTLPTRHHAALLSSALCVVLLAIPSGIGDSSSDVAKATFTYGDGGAATGQLNGSIDVLRARMSTPDANNLVLEHVEAHLEIVQVSYNITAVRGVAGFQEQIVATYETRTIPIEAGSLHVLAEPEALVALYGAGFPLDNPDPLPVTIEATGIEWGPARFRAQGEAFWYHHGDAPLRLVDAFAMPHRTTNMAGAGFLEIDGGWVMHLRDVALVADGRAIPLDPHYQITQYTSDATDTLRRAEVTLTEAFLFVDAGHVTLDTAGIVLEVGDMNVTVLGEAVFHGARGSYAVGSTSGMLRHQTLGLRGAFGLEEKVPPSSTDGPARPEVQGVAAGSFAVLAVDFMVQANGPTGPSLLEKALWVTITIGLLSLVVWGLQHLWVLLYTRINEDAVLDHPRRAEIMSFVEANPGCHVLRVAEDLGLARGVARHHLMVLERAGRLHRYHDYGQTLLVPAHQSKHDALRALAEEDPTLASIRALVAAGAVTRAQLVAMLRNRHGVADPTARRWIHKAVRAGLIDEARSGQDVIYHMTS